MRGSVATEQKQTLRRSLWRTDSPSTPILSFVASRSLARALAAYQRAAQTLLRAAEVQERAADVRSRGYERERASC